MYFILDLCVSRNGGVERKFEVVVQLLAIIFGLCARISLGSSRVAIKRILPIPVAFRNLSSLSFTSRSRCKIPIRRDHSGAGFRARNIWKSMEPRKSSIRWYLIILQAFSFMCRSLCSRFPIGPTGEISREAFHLRYEPSPELANLSARDLC